MPTPVRIPASLPKSVDRQAKARRTWTPKFPERLREVDEDTRKAVDDMLGAVRRGRRSKDA
jgi:hypothetical protein